MSNNTYLVETPENRVLVDTGLGSHVFPGDTHEGGRLVPTLRLLGIEPESIDTVILTHGHPDHIGEATDVQGKPTFPNARYLIHEQDWTFWTENISHEDPFLNFMLSVSNAKLKPLGDRVERFRGDTELVAGIRAIEAPGHTPGHTALLFESKGDKLLDTIDSASHPKIAFEKPDWIIAADMDPQLAFESRQRLLSIAAEEKIQTIGHHHPFPGLGRVGRTKDGNFTWTPSPD